MQTSDPKGGPRSRGGAWLWAGVAALMVASGCSSKRWFELRGAESGAKIDARPSVAAYRYNDNNTADLYLTDLPREVLDPEADLTDISGQLTHIHMFMNPRAGRTPIDATACSFSVRHVVVARGQIGVYGGGGFMLPKGRPGDDRFGGRIEDATLRLVSASAGFTDRLGAATLNARAMADLDEPMAGVLADRFRTLLDRTNPVAGTDASPDEPAADAENTGTR